MASRKARALLAEFVLHLKLFFVAPFQADTGRAKKIDGILSTVEAGKASSRQAVHISSRRMHRTTQHGKQINTIPRVLSLIAMFSAAMFALVTLLAVAFFEPLWSRAHVTIPADGTTERFTILILSYGPRLNMLQGAIRHYSRCPSAESVLVVWNAGPPPDPNHLQLSSSIPVRIRIEEMNSLNNRFRLDSAITTRAVFSIDDDIRIPCADVEAAFVEWRTGPEALVGFFPRLIEAQTEGELVPTFNGEAYAVRNGQYNAVLSGAAFLDAVQAFQLYWSDDVAPARAVVDEVFNGEDLLMNFVLSNNTMVSGRSAVRFYRPKRRLDISKLSSVGISHDMAAFRAATVRYLEVFTEVFDGSPLRARPFEWTLGKGRKKPWFCEIESIGCVYL